MLRLALRILTSPILLGLTLFLAGSFSALVGWSRGNDMFLLQEKGTQTQAIIDGGSILTKRRSGRKVTKFDIHWTTPAGETLRETGLKVSSELLAKLVRDDMLIADRFPIKYVKDEGRVIVMPTQDIADSAGVAQGMLDYGSVFGALGLTLFGFFGAMKLRNADFRLTET